MYWDIRAPQGAAAGLRRAGPRTCFGMPELYRAVASSSLPPQGKGAGRGAFSPHPDVEPPAHPQGLQPKPLNFAFQRLPGTAMFPRDARIEGYDPELAQAIANERQRQED